MEDEQRIGGQQLEIEEDGTRHQQKIPQTQSKEPNHYH